MGVLLVFGVGLLVSGCGLLVSGGVLLILGHGFVKQSSMLTKVARPGN